MLYDREYMRRADGAFWRSPVNVLLVVLGALFLVECILRVYGNTSLAQSFGLEYGAVLRHEYWRLLTYQFLHDAPWPLHILFNGLALWFFGRPVLERIGALRFWGLYLGSGLVGAFFELACQAWHPGYGSQVTVGASASVLGLAGAFCFLYPTQESVFFLYVIPVRLRSMTLFWILFGFSVFGTVFPHGRIAHAAHLGGLLTGVAFVRLWLEADLSGWSLPGWLRGLAARRRAVRVRPLPEVVTKAASRPARAAQAAVDSESPEDFMRREVDPILDKISAHGLQSLTERERRILEKARERMRNR